MSKNTVPKSLTGGKNLTNKKVTDFHININDYCYYMYIYIYIYIFFTDCQLYAVGKPVYHRYTNMSYGSWMRDAQPLSEANSQKFWFTNESDPYFLYEYLNKTLFRAGIPSFTYSLQYPFKVTADSIS